MPNGIKIDMRCGFSSDYVLNQIRTVFAKEFKVPKDFLFPDKELVNVTVKDSYLNTVLTDELKNKWSITVTHKDTVVKDWEE